MEWWQVIGAVLQTDEGWVWRPQVMSWESAFNHHMLDLTLSEEDVEALRSERSIKQTKIVSCVDFRIFFWKHGRIKIGFREL